MTNEEFQCWLAGVEQLTVAQHERLQQVAQEQGDEAASLAAIELRVDARRRCPRCGAGGAVRRGCVHRLRRYACKACRRTFHALTGTPLAELHQRERWLACGRALVARESVRKAAERCGVAPSTASRWPDWWRPTRRASGTAARGSGTWPARGGGTAGQAT